MIIKRIFARRVRSHSSGRRQLQPLVAACSPAASGAAGEGAGDLSLRRKSASIGVSILPPLRETISCTPNKLFEYMGYGLAVVASNFAPIRNVVFEHKTGFVVDPRDSSAVADGIAEAFNDHRALGRRALVMIQTHFCWENQLDFVIEYA